MTAFGHFAKRFSLIMMPLYSSCLTVQSGKTEVNAVNWSTCSGSQIYKENSSFDLSDCFALSERAEGTGPFLLPFFLLLQLGMNFELATELKVFFFLVLDLFREKYFQGLIILNFQGKILSAEAIHVKQTWKLIYYSLLKLLMRFKTLKIHLLK